MNYLESQNLENDKLIFEPFGNVGVSITKEVLKLCDIGFGYGIMTKIALRCLELDNELFVFLAPLGNTLHIGFFDTSHNCLQNSTFSNIKGLKDEIKLFYSEGRMMLMTELINTAF